MFRSAPPGTSYHQGKRRKTSLIAFMDDHSRLVPHRESLNSESVKSLLIALEDALFTGEPPRKIHGAYKDQGNAGLVCRASASGPLEHTSRAALCQ
jgi:hypothetical protein